MKQLKCEMCGSTDLVKQDGLFVCQVCGTKYSVEEAKKMMVEGTVEVQGTVQVDNSSYVQKYLKMHAERKQKKIGKKPKNTTIWWNKMIPITLKLFFIALTVKPKRV